MSDTIAAVATGSAPSAIGVIRISGSGTLDAVEAVFRRADGGEIRDGEDRRLYYGSLQDRDGQVLDMCLCTVSRGPHSYTGEDTAELQCHGSPIVLGEALHALFAAGARQAQPGEFTKRAFLNGKMDLMQAEAVVDLIDAETAAMAKSAAGKLQSSVARLTDAVYDRLVDMIAHFHAVLDYPDEDIGGFQLETYQETLRESKATLARLLRSFDRGRILKEGMPVAIIGRPNAGKSSLLNALAGFERAIVTQVPGTTRDTVEEKINVGGCVLRLIDTAGIRETEDEVEKLGVRRSLEAARQAQLILLVLDGSQPAGAEEWELLRRAQSTAPTVAVVNKCDLPLALSRSRLEEEAGRICYLSARTGQGLEQLQQRLEEMLPADAGEAGGREIITNQRQADCLQRALDGVEGASAASEQGMPPDIVVSELERALQALDELSGRKVRDEVVSRIFSRFCVGK